jgi:hypothetical protein
MQEGILTIDMQDVKVDLSCNCEDNTDGVDSDDGSKGFVEVESSNLRVALYNDPCLVLFKVAFCVSFDFEHPFERNGSLARR